MTEIKLLAAALVAAFLCACGGGGETMKYSNAEVGDNFVYADGQWIFADPEGKWLIRGTSENDDFGPRPVWWYLPKGQENGREWWKLEYTDKGLLNSASPSEQAYNASMVNDAFTKAVYVKDHPVVYFDYELPVFTGEKVRATIGVSLRYPDGSEFYIERNLKRTDNFDSCEGYLDRCTGAVFYFPPVDGPVDIRALLIQVLPVEKADSLRIAGVYIGSEIYGTGRVDLLLKSYSVL